MILGDSSYGPIFGSGSYSDIVIYDNSNKNKSSHCGFPSAYGVGEVLETAPNGYAHISGEYKFTTKEIEVFQVNI